MQENLTVSQIIRESLKAFTSNIYVFTIFAFLTFVPMELWKIYAVSAYSDGFYRDSILNSEAIGETISLESNIALTIITLYQVIIQAAFVVAYLQVARGKKLGAIGKAFSDGRPQAMRVLMATVAVLLITFIGFILLIVPGLIAFFLLFLTIYIVADKPKMKLGDAMRYSKELVSSNAGLVFGVFALTVFAAIVVYVGVLAIFANQGEAREISLSLISAYGTVLSSIITAVLYVRLSANVKPTKKLKASKKPSKKSKES